MKLAKPSAPTRILTGFLAVMSLSGCLENEGQVQELRQLREKLTVAEKKLAERTQQPAQTTITAQDIAETAQKLRKAEQQIAELEKKLQEQASRPATPSDQSITPAATARTADSLGLLVEAMENDLLNKVGELRASLGKTIPEANLKGATTIKRLRPLDKIAPMYDSTITFKVADKHGNTCKLVFPVQPGTDGRWHLPSLAIIQEQIKAFINRDWPQSGLPSHAGSHLTSPLPVPPGHVDKTQKKPADQDTFVIRWDTSPVKEDKLQSTPVANAPVPPAASPPPITTPSPSAKEAQSAPPPEPRRTPALIMPVMKDVQVQFE